MRNPDKYDQLLKGVNTVLKLLSSHSVVAKRANPACQQEEKPLSQAERRHSAGLMRINHTGEVCAQGLYHGQALTAKLQHTRKKMEQAIQEEEDHLAWCQDRLVELDSRSSRLNPVFFGLSYTLGALAGVVGDRVSLGFVAATEDQVCRHLKSHLQELPESDQKSRAIIEQMLVDEAHHAEQALEAGGIQFPGPVKSLMTLVSKVMTKTTYHI